MTRPTIATRSTPPSSTSSKVGLAPSSRPSTGAALQRRMPRGREAEPVVRLLLSEHGVAHPGVTAEQQVPLRLHERPLTVELLLSSFLRQ